MWLSTVALGLAATVWGLTLGATRPGLTERQTSKDAYGFIYFTGEGLANGEQIYFAVSNGSSPASWTAVNGGQSVLTSTLGTKGVRDPYIIRDPSGSKFYIIATDLKMYGGGSWDDASRHGSLSLAIWETTDLKTFSAERLVKVSPVTAGMSWAPEATYDPSTGKFMVYWASNLYASSDTNHTGSSYARVMYATTTDFRTFTPAQVWIDPGMASGVIDTTVAFNSVDGYYYRFSKMLGHIVQERSKTLLGSWQTVTSGIGESQFGDMEGPLVFESIVYPGVWHLFLDDISPHGYQPFETDDIAAGQWTFSTGYNLPTNPRHGTVFAISNTEYQNLLSL